MFIRRRVLVDVRDLLVNVTFDATAQRRIELSQIADLHEISVISSGAKRSREISYR